MRCKVLLPESPLRRMITGNKTGTNFRPTCVTGAQPYLGCERHGDMHYRYRLRNKLIFARERAASCDCHTWQSSSVARSESRHTTSIVSPTGYSIPQSCGCPSESN